VGNRGVSLPNRFRIWVNSSRWIRAAKAFWSIFSAEMLLTTAVFIVFVYERSTAIVARGKIVPGQNDTFAAVVLWVPGRFSR